MRTFYCPKEWFDLKWMQERPLLSRIFDSINEPIKIVFDSCEWIDLQPLIDLFLHIHVFVRGGGNVVLQIQEIQDSPKQIFSRAHRFLIESGFLNGLTNLESVTLIADNRSQSIDDFLDYSKSMNFYSRILDFETIIPCLFINVADFQTREDVFRFCHELREEYLAKGKDRELGQGKSKSLRLPAPLIQELKYFFNSVLAELIDNVRIHKKSEPKYAAIYMRVRKREDKQQTRNIKAEPSVGVMTTLKKSTTHFWQNDIIESVFADIGESIQDSFIRGWTARKRPTEKVPKMDGRRVDGPNADFIILQNILEQNNSALSAEERRKENLPLKLTGLHSIRYTILNSNWFFSINSGEIYAVIGNLKKEPLTEADFALQTKMGGRFTKFDGVHYFFRFAAIEDRPLGNWADGLAKQDISQNENWWKTKNLRDPWKVMFISKFEIPETVGTGSFIICRANHVPNKNKLYQFLRTAKNKGINVIFAELSTSIAHYLSIQIDLLIKYGEINILCPILTNTLRVCIPGEGNNRYLRSFNSESYAISESMSLWWANSSSPIRCVRDVFLLCRYYDSKVFWGEVLKDKVAFIREPVIWSEEIVLLGGYLSFYVALRKSKLLKLIRKRVLAVAHALRVKEIIPVSNALRHLANEVQQGFVPVEHKAAHTAILGDILVTGTTFCSNTEEGSIPHFWLPVFQYPLEKIRKLSGNSYGRKVFPISALDWMPEVKLDFEFDAKRPCYQRIGTSDKIQKKSEEDLQIYAEQQPEFAYRVWQTHSLINIGHYSYENYHYYIWLDIYGFINSRTSDAINMIDDIARRIDDVKPACILYSPNEDCELLVHTLIQHAKEQGLRNFPSDDRIMPVKTVQEFLYVGTKNFEDIIANFIEELDKDANIIFIDDAMVSGKTNREVRSCLKEKGFENIYSFVILDRVHPRIELIGGNIKETRHFSYWNLSIPPAGTDQTCRFCRGIENLRFQSSKADSDTVKRNLERWTNHWSKTDNLLRFENKLERKWLKKEIRKKLGKTKEKNISLRTSEALCTWALDMMAKLDYFSYPFNKPRTDISESLTEIISGQIFMFWQRLSNFEQTQALKYLVDQMWTEERESARGLIAVAAVSLRRRGVKKLVRILKEKIVNEGIPHFDAGLFVYVISQINPEVSKNHDDLINYCLNKVMLEKKSIDFDRTLGLLRALSQIHRREIAYLPALQIIGFPGRGFHHYYIYALLAKIIATNKPALYCQEELNELKCLLEPVQKIVEDCPYLFEEKEVMPALEDLFRKFNLLFLNHSSQLDNSSELSDIEFLQDTVTDIKNYLSTDIKGKMNLRRILGLEFVHYLPFEVRKVIKSIIELPPKKEIKWEEQDFLINIDPTSEETMLLDFDIANKRDDLREEYDIEREVMMEKLQENDIVYMPRSKLNEILRDVLIDVEYPKGRGMKIDGDAFMKINFGVEMDPNGIEYYCIHFDNKALEEDAGRADGRTWNIIKIKMETSYGRAKIDYKDSTLRRTLMFPFLRAKITEGKNVTK